VASVDFIGEPLSTVHPNLEGQTDLRFEEIPAGQAAQGMDVVLLGLPHKVSAHKMPELMASGARVVDLSGDFRLRDAATYQRYYGASHPCPEKLAGEFVYGLPELHREAIKKARYVASPGCFATTIELALLPLARRGLLNGPSRWWASPARRGAVLLPARERTTRCARSTCGPTSRSTTNTSPRSSKPWKTPGPNRSRFGSSR